MIYYSDIFRDYNKPYCKDPNQPSSILECQPSCFFHCLFILQRPRWYPTSPRPQFLCPKPCLVGGWQGISFGVHQCAAKFCAYQSKGLKPDFGMEEWWISMNFWANYSNRSPPVGLPPKWPQPLLNSGLGIIGICPDEYVLCEMGQFFQGILAHLLRMVMERKFYAEKVSNTPQASAENMTACLGIWKLLFGWLIYMSFRFHVFSLFALATSKQT